MMVVTLIASTYLAVCAVASVDTKAACIQLVFEATTAGEAAQSPSSTAIYISAVFLCFFVCTAAVLSQQPQRQVFLCCGIRFSHKATRRAAPVKLSKISPDTYILTDSIYII